jgi:hypothetical protein
MLLFSLGCSNISEHISSDCYINLNGLSFDEINEKMNWENKQNSLKKRTMYVPTSIPGQVRLVEID